MPTIQEYRFGHIVIDGTEHARDVIVLPHRVVGEWWRKEGHELVLEDLSEVLDELPEHLIVGCGAQSRMKPDPAALDELRARGINVVVMPTHDAVRRYGERDPSVTAAALHLTC